MQAVGAVVVKRQHGVPGQLALHPQAPELGIGRLDVLADVTQAAARERLRSRAPSQRTGVAGGDWIGGHICSCNQRDHGIVGRILDDIEGYVAKVPLIGDTVSAAQAGLAVAKHIPGKTHARGKVTPLWRPQMPVRAVGDRSYQCVLYVLHQRGAGTIEQVRIQVLVVVVLHPVVLPA